MAEHGIDRRSPRHRAALAAAKACFGAWVMAGLILLLAHFHIGPFHRLELLDEFAYLKSARPKLLAEEKTAPVVFVDVDDKSLENWGRSKTFEASCSTHDAPKVWTAPDSALARDGPAQGTPRLLVAEIVRTMRQKQVAVIFLDIDLRTHHDDDDALALELGCKGTNIPVLIPHYFKNGSVPPCGKQPSEPGSSGFVTLDTAFGPAFREGAGPPDVQAVHALVSVAEAGYADSVCSSYKLSPKEGQPAYLPAAMAQAVRIAKPTAQVPALEPPRELPLRWLVDAETNYEVSEAAPHHPAQLVYQRLPAWQCTTPESVLLPARSAAIVVVGSSHFGASDIHSTPFGNMVGALVQVNAGLSGTLEHERELEPMLHFALELFLASVCCALIGLALWLVYGRFACLARYPLVSQALESLLVLLGMAIFAVIGWWLSAWWPFATWHFTVLSFILAAVLVCTGELLVLSGHAFESLVEVCLKWWAEGRTKGGR